MRSLRNALLATAAGAAALLGLSGQPARAADPTPAVRGSYEHVLLISVDGMHAIDLTNWVEHHPTGNFAKLASHGITYPRAIQRSGCGMGWTK